MATLAEIETYEAGVYQLEITDPVIGGPDGIDNLQAKQLANRTKWLKSKMDSILSMNFIHTAVAENPGDTDEFGFYDSFTGLLRKVTFGSLKSNLNSGYKNLLLNGNFNVWQRGNGPFASGTAVCTADRWVLSGTTGIGLRDISAGALRLYATVAGTYIGIQQRVEGGAWLSGKQITISFERYTAIASPNTSISVQFKKISDGTTLTTSIYELKSFGVVGAWTNESVTLTIPSFTHSPSDVMMEFNISITNATAATCDTSFRKMQIEGGSVQTNLEVRPDALELMMCQRYYEPLDGTIYGAQPAAGASSYVQWNFKVVKRISPTLTGALYSGSSIGAISTRYIQYSNIGTNAGVTSPTASSEL